MKKALLYLILSIITFTASSQTFNWVYAEKSEACIGKPLTVLFNTSGQFGSSNRFRTQLLYSRYEDGLTKNYTVDLAGESTTSPIKVIIPDTIPNLDYFFIKIISSDPVVHSTPSPTRVTAKYPIGITSMTGSANTNPGEFATIYGTFTGLTPAKLYLSDSSVVNIADYQSNFIFHRNPSQTTTYSILMAENACGVSTPPAPSVTLTVNPLGFRLLNVTAAAPCVGSLLYLSYDNETAFNADNVFSAVLTYSDLSGTHTVAVPCTVFKPKVLTLKIPESLKETGIYITKVTLNSTSPRAVASSNTQEMYIPVVNLPEFAVQTDKVDFSWSRTIEIVVINKNQREFNGEILLKDGNNLLKIEPTYTGNPYEIHLRVSPDVSTNYEVIARPYGCEHLSKTVGNVKVDVAPGLRIIDISREVCENGRGQIKYQKKGNFNPDNTFGLKLHYYDEVSKSVTIPVRILNDSIAEFTLSQNYFSDPIRYSYTNAGVGMVSTSPVSESEQTEMAIKRKPTLVIDPPYRSQYLDIGGGFVSFASETSGGSPYIYVINDGQNQFSTRHLAFNPVKTTTYAIKEVTNSCGTTAYNDFNLTVTVKYSTPQAFHPFVSGAEEIYACEGSIVEIPFAISGTVDTSDIYHVEIQVIENNLPVWRSLGSSRTSPVRFRMPDDLKDRSYYYRLRNPVKNIEWFAYYQLFPARKPTASITATEDPGVLLAGSLGTVEYQVQGGGNINLELSNGMKSQTPYNSSDTRGFFSIKLDKTETYSIRSVSNECGTGAATGQKSFTVKNFRITTSRITGGYASACEGNIIVLHKSETGTLPANAAYRVQMSDVTGTLFGDIDSYQSNGEIHAIVPEGIYELYKQRKFRIITTNGDGIYESTGFISVLARPSATLTGEGGSTVVDNIDEKARLTLNFKGSPSWYFSLNYPIVDTDYYYDNDYLKYGYTTQSAFNVWAKPGKAGDAYKIKHLWNECGYGTFSGEVKIGSVKPKIVVQSIMPAERSCVGNEITLTCSATGTFNDNNVFRILLSSNSGQNYELMQTPTLGGTYKVKILANVPGGNYTLSVTASSPEMSVLSPYVITQAPEVKISGNTIVNHGETAYLALTGRFAVPYDFKLSDGTTGTITSMNDFDRTMILVRPEKTTQYTIISASNICGAGTVSGNATVVVNPPSDKTIVVTSFQTGSSFCSGASIEVYFLTQGSFSASNKFSVQLSDENGNNFTDLPTTGLLPLKTVLPLTIKKGENYRLRVVASDPGVSSAASPFMFRIYEGASAKLLSNAAEIMADETVTVKIELTGNDIATRTVYFGTDRPTANMYTTLEKLLTISMKPLKSEVYRLYEVSDNYCGKGVVLGDNTFTINIILGSENPGEVIEVYPNPTTQFIRIKNIRGIPSKISLVNVSGKKALLPVETENGRQDYDLDIRYLPAGTYFLNIEQNNKVFTRKIIKL